MPATEIPHPLQLGDHLTWGDIGTGDWFEVTQQRIDLFAEATEDRQWIHTDPERAARESPCQRGADRSARHPARQSLRPHKAGHGAAAGPADAAAPGDRGAPQGGPVSVMGMYFGRTDLEALSDWFS
jgi:hypothetical protein